MKNSKYDYLKMHAVDGMIDVKSYTHNGYPKSSVCVGMTLIKFVGTFETETDAMVAFPELTEDCYSSKFMDADLTRMPSMPPADFDPYYAGERWEDDY